MIIVGCDFHPSWQQVAVLDTETGEVIERKLVNGDREAERCYRQLPVPSLIGVEACGNSQWFIDLLQRLGHKVWIGDAAQIRASYVRKQFGNAKHARARLSFHGANGEPGNKAIEEEVVDNSDGYAGDQAS